MKNFARRVERWPWFGFPIWLFMFLFGWRCRHWYSRGMCVDWTRCAHLDGHECSHMALDGREWQTGDHWEVRQ